MPVFMERKDEKNENLNPTQYSKDHSFSRDKKKKDVLKFQAAQSHHWFLKLQSPRHEPQTLQQNYLR